MFGPQGPTLSVHSGNRNDIRCVAALVLRHMNPQMIGNARHRMQTCIGFMISPRGDMPVGNECEACVRQEPWKGRSNAKTLVTAVRSEARRVGKEGVSTCRYRWSPAR